MSTITRITDRFEIINSQNHAPKFIGQGGMGSVYLGIDQLTGEPVAIKVLKADIIRRNPDMIERFRREGETLRQLNHPNIVKMLGTAEKEGIHYLIMEYVSGGSLRDLLDQQPRLSVQRALYIALDLADALTRAHRLNILHRDIKPANVLLAEDGTPRLTDFGMARARKDPHITEDGAIVGTLAYMPPELFQGEEPDERSDIWAFGVMLYEMLAGKHPYPYDQPGQLVNAILTQAPQELEDQRNDLPTGLIDLIYRMLTKDRHSRIRSVRLVGAELETIIRGGDSSVQTVVPTDSNGRFETQTPIPSNNTRTPHNLPVQPTPFVGRDRELGDIEELLQQPNMRLLTLIGPGGMGKTRLAIAAAERQLEHYPDGVYFVPLAPLDDTAFIVPTIAESMHFEFSGNDPQRELLDYLAEKRVLLVFDNYEHLVAGANIVADILQASPQTNVLVTSRERLRLRGEHLYDVAGMVLPHSDNETPVALAAYPAVKLFLQSAHRVSPDFDVTESNAHDVAQIMRMVQGLPLGIELAAAWLEYLPVHEIVTEMQGSLDFLETDLQDVPERHRSIRAVFDYSWNLMSAEEQKVFMQLAVFRGGFEREAAQKVTGASLRTLTTLVNKSLLRRDPDGRYFVHTLLRQYAQDKLDDPALQADTCRRHAQYYADFLSKLTPALSGAKEVEALQAIDRELENIRVAWGWGIKTSHWDAYDAVLQPKALFYLGRSMLREGYEGFEALAEALRAAGLADTRLYWRTINRKLWLAGRMGEYNHIVTQAQQALAFFKAEDDKVEASIALNSLAYANIFLGNYDEAIQNASDAIECVQNLEDPMSWHMAMGNLGYTYLLLGDYSNARTIYEAINHTTQQVGYSPSGTAYMRNNLGEILREIGEIDEACTHFEEAYAVFEQLGHRRGMAFTLNNIGGVYFVKGDYPNAQQMYERAYHLNKEIGDKRGIGHSLSALGNSAQMAGELEQAQAYFEQSLAVRREAGEQRGIVDSLTDLADVQNAMGHYDKAAQMFNEAIRMRRDLKDRAGEGFAHAGLAMALMLQGRMTEAEANIRIALQIGKELGNGYLIAQGTAGLAEAAIQNEDVDEAERLYKDVLRMNGATKITGLVVFVLTGIARVYALRGDDERALEIVALVLQYPRNFIGMVQGQAQALFDDLSKRIDRETIDTAIHTSQTRTLQHIVDELMAEEPA